MTPGNDNIVHVSNIAPVEFPMTAVVVPGSINNNLGNNYGYTGYGQQYNSNNNGYYNQYNNNNRYGNRYGNNNYYGSSTRSGSNNDVYSNRRTNGRYGGSGYSNANTRNGFNANGYDYE